MTQWVDLGSKTVQVSVGAQAPPKETNLAPIILGGLGLLALLASKK